MSKEFRSVDDVQLRLRSFDERMSKDGILVVPPAQIVSSTVRPIFAKSTNDDSVVLVPSTTMAPPFVSSTAATSVEKHSAESSEEEETDKRHRKGKTPMRGNGGLSISAVWEGVKRMMGFTADCHNGGYKTIGGDCICPQFFEGRACERVVCANNGTRVRVAAFGGEEVCKCTHPQYISGKHCEVVHCQNGGRLLNDGTCHCVDGWYTGQFCQFYTSSWLIAFGIPLLVIAAIVFCCVICRLDLCALRRPSPPPSSRHNRRPNGRRSGQNGTQSAAAPAGTRRCRSGENGRGNRHRREQMPFRGPLATNGTELTQQHNHHQPQQQHQMFMQQNLLNDRHQNHQQQQYVLRLEQVPVYNPRLFASLEQSKPLEPPPPYEQAIRCPPHQHNQQCPPIYSPAQMNEANNENGRETNGNEMRNADGIDRTTQRQSDDELLELLRLRRQPTDDDGERRGGGTDGGP
ncbi:hypothetical protein niasHT_030449 [Heterodera trifolii]|uniref:EGF-like domain-containing protein n=1 Tax=Heterodera trifolii TaxID=157864 RepID=A0ABD2J619_9BILA